MSKDLVNPLQGLLQQAGETLPAHTGTTENFKNRLNAVGPKLLVADTSGSMESVAWGGKRKIDVLRNAVAEIMRTVAPTLIAFSSAVQEGLSEVPEPYGSTALHLALDHAAKHKPSTTIIISDGQPDDEQLAIAAAQALTGRIDTLYVGPDSDKSAIDFMRRLARLGCGEHQQADLTKPQPQLTTQIRTLLISGR